LAIVNNKLKVTVFDFEFQL